MSEPSLFMKTCVVPCVMQHNPMAKTFVNLSSNALMHERGGHIDVGQPCNSPEVFATFPAPNLRLLAASGPGHWAKSSTICLPLSALLQFPSREALACIRNQLRGLANAQPPFLPGQFARIQAQLHKTPARTPLPIVIIVMLSKSSIMRTHNSFSPRRRLFEAIAHFTALLEPPPGWPSLLPISSRQHQRATVRGRRLNFFQRLVGTGRVGGK